MSGAGYKTSQAAHDSLKLDFSQSKVEEILVKHPVHVPRDNYRGANAKKQAAARRTNMVAMDIERAINKLLLTQKEPIRTYLWMEISSAAGHSYDTVAKIGYGIDCGSGGFTAIRHDLTYEQAMSMNKKD